ncbi:glutathione S-transferase [Elstera cyanobacteriorum]|uniref:Glutathione S-transferase n=1 Tax=Elstera cyanobacteriorum TaxID=2022747 RepID=A0A255XN65_9PROT|nr:glutathione S-transferase family protein [Elstera cyanobacteriorum]OYQ17875.1 glutathione S-transferase [Elstera cyanobacteriorum]GFZ85442.1 glutathione S-transferase [Elstera cyanobacteriorum]
MALTLFIGNKNYSSWSLRPWLALKLARLPFEEVLIPLYQTTSKQDILRHSPTGKVPALKLDDGTVIFESLAICEWVAEQAPDLWPADPTARAVARAVSCEMHAGFVGLRSALPMNIRRAAPPRNLTPAAQEDINRVTALWRDCRKRFGAGGPFLFGAPSIADAMFAPVVTRFASYLVDVDEDSRAYMAAVFALPAMQEWVEAGKREPWIIEDSEAA